MPTKPTTQEIEQHYFECFAKTYPLPTGVISYQDKPDVILTGKRKIGIEITNFFLQPGELPGSEQQQRRGRTDVVAEAQASYLSDGGKKIEITVTFDGDNPITASRRRKLPNELASLIKRHDTRESGQLEWSLIATMPEISSVYLNAREYPDATWRFNGVYSVGLMSKQGLDAIVREKESKSIHYEKCDAYWLLVIVEPMDPAQEQEIRIDDLKVESTVFEKVFVYKPKFEHVVEAK